MIIRLRMILSVRLSISRMPRLSMVLFLPAWQVRARWADGRLAFCVSVGLLLSEWRDSISWALSSSGAGIAEAFDVTRGRLERNSELRWLPYRLDQAYPPSGLPWIFRTLKAKFRGYWNYYGVIGNSASLAHSFTG